MQSSAADWGRMLIVTRIAGRAGAGSLDGDKVTVSTPGGTEVVQPPEDLRYVPPEPPPADLMVTAYDLLHSTRLDRGPYTRLPPVFRDRILPPPLAGDPRPINLS